MRSNEEITYWLEIAQDDLRVAGRLIDSNDRLHALFFCHLGIEKMLKALYVNMEILQKVKKWRRRLIAEIRKQGTR